MNLLIAAILYQGIFGPADFATKLFDYNAINGVPGYANPLNVLGYPGANATPTVPDNSGVFSFGWGGYVTVGFDRPVLNGAGPDLIIFGNAFYVGGDPDSIWREPGYVEVGVDVDGNGVPSPGDRWYLILGNPAPPFPLPSSYWGIYPGLTRGYADCSPTDNTGNPLIPTDPDTPGIAPGSAGGDAIDLDWAVDEMSGQPVHLAAVNFVRITHALNTGSFLGPSSTEVDAIAIAKHPLVRKAVPIGK
jgi:hypothetical protein